MGNPVRHFEVVGKDAQVLQSFYANAFGWELKPSLPTYAMAYPHAEAGINGGIGAPMDGGSGHVTFYIDVSDLEATLGTIERLGGRRVTGPMDVPKRPQAGAVRRSRGARRGPHRGRFRTGARIAASGRQPRYQRGDTSCR